MLLDKIHDSVKKQFSELDTKMLEMFLGVYAVLIAFQILHHPGMSYGVPFLQSAIKILHFDPAIWFVVLIVAGGLSLFYLFMGWKNSRKFFKHRAYTNFVLFLVWAASAIAIFTTLPFNIFVMLLYIATSTANLVITMCLVIQSDCLYGSTWEMT